MVNIFIIHGTGGHPKENWFPWLKKKLESLGCRVIVAQFPTPKNQTPESWFEVFKKYEEFYNKDTILIGHSLGGAFILRVLEKYNTKIKAAFIVAAPIGIPPIKNWQSDQPFIGHKFDWEKIRSHCNKFFVYHSDNDPYVSLGNGKELSKKLKTKLIFIPNSGHFNKAAGFIGFEELFNRVKIEL